MSDGTVIQIDDKRGVQVHPESGLITVWVKTITTKTVNGNVQSWSGPVRGYGCDALAFQGQFQGKIDNLLAWIKSKHLAYDGAHETLIEELGKLRGKTI